MTKSRDTGLKTPSGHSVHRGERGGLFVVRNGERQYLNRNHAIHKELISQKRTARRETFTDPISLEDHPVREGILLNKQLYHPASMRDYVKSGGRTVPHSRRALTKHEKRTIGALGGRHEGWQPLHRMFNSSHGRTSSHTPTRKGHDRRTGFPWRPRTGDIRLMTRAQLIRFIGEWIDADFWGLAAVDVEGHVTTLLPYGGDDRGHIHPEDLVARVDRGEVSLMMYVMETERIDITRIHGGRYMLWWWSNDRGYDHDPIWRAAAVPTSTFRRPLD